MTSVTHILCVQQCHEVLPYFIVDIPMTLVSIGFLPLLGTLQLLARAVPCCIFSVKSAAAGTWESVSKLKRFKGCWT